MKKPSDDTLAYMALAFLITAIAIFIVMFFLPENLQDMALFISLGILGLGLLVPYVIYTIGEERELDKSRKALEEKERKEAQRWAQLTEEERERERIENARREKEIREKVLRNNKLSERELRESKKRKNDIRNASLVIIKFLLPGFIFAGLVTQNLSVVGLGVLFTIAVSMLPALFW